MTDANRLDGMRWPMIVALIIVGLIGTFRSSTDLYAQDCNGNGELDAIDIAFGGSADCDLNGVPDECDILLPARSSRHFSILHVGDGTLPLEMTDPLTSDTALTLHTDHDGNGMPDLLVGDPGAESSRGRAHLVRFATDRSVLGTVRFGAGLSPWDELGAQTLPPLARFGASIASLGNLDGDLTSEVAIGAPGMGSIWICSLDDQGVVTRATPFGIAEVADPTLLDDLNAFGTSVAAIGDLDGDGVSELAVGAPGTIHDNSPGGAVWVLFLNANGTVREWRVIDDGSTPFSVALNERFGESLTALGDLNGDGRSELAVGSPLWGGLNQGALRILFLSATGVLTSSQLHSGAPTGKDVSSVGDHTGDTVPDLLVRKSISGYELWPLNPDGTRAPPRSLAAVTNPFPGNSGRDSAPILYPDSDGDGLDEWLIAGGSATLPFGNPILDPGNAIFWVDLASRDCDANGILDSCEIAAGNSIDVDSDGVPDACACPPPTQVTLDTLSDPMRLSWIAAPGSTETRIDWRSWILGPVPRTLAVVPTPLNELEVGPCPGPMRLFIRSVCDRPRGPTSSNGTLISVPLSLAGDVRVAAPVERLSEALPVPASGGAELERTFHFEFDPAANSCSTFLAGGYTISFAYDPTVLEVVSIERPDVFEPWWDITFIESGMWAYGMLACCDGGEISLGDQAPAADVTFRVLPASPGAGTDPFLTPIGAGVLTGQTEPIGVLATIDGQNLHIIGQVSGTLALRYTFPGFVRGDANESGTVDIGDAVAILHGLFSGAPLTCLAAADANDDDAVDVGDAIKVLSHLFDGAAAPPAPFPNCGADPTPGALSTCSTLCP